MIWADNLAWQSLVSRWVAARPTASNFDGLKLVRQDCVQLLRAAGFVVERYDSDVASEQPILIARRKGTSPQWLGLTAHYDVEEAGVGWASDPWTVCERDQRLFGRGVADNLGPLAQRLLSLASLAHDGPNIVWVIEGEEELGSPWAQRLFPRLELPGVDLWLEETGYFYKDGAQRILTRGVPGPLIDAIGDVALEYGREVRVRERFLNKAFGSDRCPTLQYLVGNRPYLAIGPNDDWARVHGTDESIDPTLLPLCHAQLGRLLEVLG